MSEKIEEVLWTRPKRLSKEPRTVEETPAEKQPGPPAAPVDGAAGPPAAPTGPKPSDVPMPARPRPAPLAQDAEDAVQDTEDAETVIGIHSFFDGTLRCESSLRIKGVAQGAINCTRSLVVEETATVKAKVRAANAIIGGSLDGSVVCDGRLEVLATGKVSGELTAAVLIVQEGAFFEGRLKVRERKRDGSSKAGSGVSRIFGFVARAFGIFAAL